MNVCQCSGGQWCFPREINTDTYMHTVCLGWCMYVNFHISLNSHCVQIRASRLPGSEYLQVSKSFIFSLTCLKNIKLIKLIT